MHLKPSNLFSRLSASLPLALFLTLSCTTTADKEEKKEAYTAPTLPALADRPAVKKAEAIPGFMRGINLGNYLDSPKNDPWRKQPIDEKHIEHVAKMGFDHVRFPVRFSAYTATKAPYAIDAKFLKQVDKIIELAYKHKLGVVLDVHHYEEIMKNPEAEEKRFLAIWSQLSRHYKKHAKEKLAFEPLNEPSGAMDSKWNALASKVIKTIRAQNKDRLIIIDSVFWAAPSRLKEVNLPETAKDKNIIISFHMYEPFLFTHQAAPWVTPKEMVAATPIVFPGPGPKPVKIHEVPKDLAWVTEWLTGYNTKPAAENPSGPVRVAEELAHADALIAQGRRLYMGEFGAIDFADAASRENYVRYIRQEAERRNIGWSYWDDGGNYKLIDLAGGDVEYLKKALFD
jgi:endoglucanase